MRIDLGHGHFLIEADETVETLRIESRNEPGKCQQDLVAVAIGSERIDVRPAATGCDRDRNAIVRINPAWQSVLDLRASAGQIDFAASSVAHIASVSATVNTGDISGIPAVQRSWLVGARAQFDSARPGMHVAVHVSVGQIHFAAPDAP
jgi:uncharacterized protein (DUF3084 family)